MPQTVDLVRCGICVLVALLLCTLRLRLVLWVDTIHSFVIGGLMVYYAQDVFKMGLSPTTATDNLHEFLMDTRVVLMLMPAFTWLFCRSTVDITCRTALTLSRLVMYGGAAIVMLIEHFRTNYFTDFHLCYSVLPCSLWAFVMVVQLIRTGSRVNIHIRRVDINRFLSIDLFLLLALAIVDLSVPEYIGSLVDRRLDPLHVYLHRVNGCFYLGMAIIPWIGHRFRYPEDKHTVLAARVVCLLIWFGGVGYGITIKQVPLTPGTYQFLGQMGVLFLPSLVAIFICQNGPFTSAYWNSQRRAVTITSQSRPISTAQPSMVPPTRPT